MIDTFGSRISAAPVQVLRVLVYTTGRIKRMRERNWCHKLVNKDKSGKRDRNLNFRFRTLCLDTFPAFFRPLSPMKSSNEVRYSTKGELQLKFSVNGERTSSKRDSDEIQAKKIQRKENQAEEIQAREIRSNKVIKNE